MSVVDLCGVCAAKMRETHQLKVIYSGKNQNVTCANCNRRRYGATYEVTERNAYDSKGKI